jgi:hypothetical protein
MRQGRTYVPSIDTLTQQGAGHMYLYDGKLYFTKDHVQLLKKGSEFVKKRYHAIANVSSSKSNVIREKMHRLCRKSAKVLF